MKKKKHNLDTLKHLYSKKKEEKEERMKDTILIQEESFLNIQEQMKFD